MHNKRDLEEFAKQLAEAQRNIVFPDTVRNGRSVDAFLWNGSHNPRPVQRVTAWMFGLVFAGMGAMFFYMAVEARPAEGTGPTFVFVLLSFLLMLLGIRIFRNGWLQKANG